MQENQGKKPQQANDTPAQEELSEIWQQLLGKKGTSSQSVPFDGVIPTLPSDPWSELIHEKGIEVVDLDKQHLQISDQEVEEMLELMQEQNNNRKAQDGRDSSSQRGSC